MTGTPTAAEPPAVTHGEWLAPASWQAIEFISDLHLHEAGPRTLAAVLAHLRESDADAICLLGDILEVWVGDDVLDEPASPEARLLQALADATRGRWIGYLPGNRDFLFGARALQHCGWHALPDPTLLCAFGQRVLLSHGDALCLDDHDYQRFRAQARDPAWQAQFLARPLDERRAIARQLRDGSEQRKQQVGLAGYADVDAAMALAWLTQTHATTLIHGHTHRPGQHTLGPDRQRWVLSDWDLDSPVAPRADLLRLSADGLVRRAPSLPQS